MRKQDSQKVLLSDEKEIQKLAARYHVPYIDLSTYSLSRELIQAFPPEFLYRSNFVPLEENLFGK